MVYTLKAILIIWDGFFVLFLFLTKGDTLGQTNLSLSGLDKLALTTIAFIG